RTIAFPLPAAWSKRRCPQRIVPAPLGMRRRPVRRPLDAHRRPQSRAGVVSHALGSAAACAAVAGIVDFLRPGQRERKLAVVRRPGAPASRGWPPALVQLILT